MTIRQTRAEFEIEVSQLLVKRFGRTEANRLFNEWSAKIHTSYSVRIPPATVAREIAKYERG
jgi:hypothetical protein